ncbi:NAD(P)H-dependent oxidoreductase [Hymenobacter terrenus]|uniref:NAD(P)H-dependent oxidoreductase n=1 Tax=Hymenobacter terrenus TaxID=1629124 RepID=UPI00061983AB|nr:NAD(P)H-dependent oxidoreductase [Hymenobacter terrenus]
MNHLLVYAHPNANSFCHAVLERIVQTSQELGHATEVRDLYALGFDPVHRGIDAQSLQTGEPLAADVRTEQQHLVWADVITLVYPNWWNGMPALLKGYIDRVFTSGFAYTYDHNGLVGLLKGKKALVFNSTGGGRELMEQIGQLHTFTKAVQVGILGFCGVEVVEQKIFHRMFELTPALAADWLDEVASICRQHLGQQLIDVA